MVPLFIAVPIGSMLAWKRGDLAGVTGRLVAAFIVTVVAVLLWLAMHDFRASLAAGGIGLGVWVIAGSLNELALRLGIGLPFDPARMRNRARGLPRSACAMTLAHVGLGHPDPRRHGPERGPDRAHPGHAPGRDRRDRRLPGPVRRRQPRRKGPNYVAQRASFTVSRDGEPFTVLHSEKRFFPVERMPTTEAGIDTNLWRDLYFVLGDQAEGGGFAVRLYYNPLVLWIWGGAGIMALARPALAERPPAARGRPAPGAGCRRAPRPRAPEHAGGRGSAGPAPAAAVRHSAGAVRRWSACSSASG